VYIGLISIGIECLAHDECLTQGYFVFELVFTQLMMPVKLNYMLSHF